MSDKQQIYREFLFDLGKVAGALSIPEVRGMLIEALANLPENERMKIHITNATNHLQNCLQVAGMQTQEKPDAEPQSPQ